MDVRFFYHDLSDSARQELRDIAARGVSFTLPSVTDSEAHPEAAESASKRLVRVAGFLHYDAGQRARAWRMKRDLDRDSPTPARRFPRFSND